MLYQKRKSISIDPQKNIELQATRQIIKDFNEFKTKNELLFCGMQIGKILNNSVDVIWTTTVKHICKFDDYGKVIGDFLNLIETNPDEIIQITKLTCQETCYIIEFTIFKTYDLKYSS